MAAKKKAHAPKAPVKPAPPTPLEVGVRAALASVMGALFFGGLAIVYPVPPYSTALLAGVFVALVFDSWTSALIAAVIGLLGAIGLDIKGVAGPASGLAMVLLPLIAAGGAAAGVALRRRVSVRIIATVMLVLVVGGFLYQAGRFAPDVSSKFASEPADEGYSFDPVFFMKVFYQVDRGVPYYQAYGESFAADARFDKPTVDLAGWRTPTTFWVWSALFSNGGQMVWGFIILAAISMTLAYYTAMRIGDPGSALLAPALLFPYYLYAIPSVWFTELEFWAGFVAIAAAALFVSERRWFALPFAALAGAMREWLLSGIVAGFAQTAKDRKWKEAAAWAATGVALIAVYLFNMSKVSAYLKGAGFTPQLGAGGRAGNGGIDFILYTLQFCSEWFVHSYVVPYAALFLALLVAGYLIYRGELYVPLAMLVPMVAFLYFGSGAAPGGDPGWNDYYNAAFMPFAFILAASAGRLTELITPAK